MYRCPVDAPSAPGRSIFISTGCAPWAPRSASRAVIFGRGRNGLRGARLVMEMVSVTGTENLMMAATLADGETLIENAAREPEVVDLADFLIAMGARIEGAGTRPDSYPGRRAAARRQLSGACRIVSRPAPSWCGAAMTGGRVRVRETAPELLDAVLHKLREAGAEIATGPDWIEVDMRRPAPSRGRTSAPRRTRPSRPTCRPSSARSTRIADGVGHSHRDHLRESLHACPGAAAHGRRDPGRGKYRHRQRSRAADRRRR